MLVFFSKNYDTICNNFVLRIESCSQSADWWSWCHQQRNGFSDGLPWVRCGQATSSPNLTTYLTQPSSQKTQAPVTACLFVYYPHLSVLYHYPPTPFSMYHNLHISQCCKCRTKLAENMTVRYVLQLSLGNYMIFLIKLPSGYLTIIMPSIAYFF